MKSVTSVKVLGDQATDNHDDHDDKHDGKHDDRETISKSPNKTERGVTHVKQRNLNQIN